MRKLPPTVFSPQELTIAVTVPSLYKLSWEWMITKIFRKRIQVYQRFAEIKIAVVVQWPDGRLTTHKIKIEGKSSSAYTRETKVNSSGWTTQLN